MNGNSYVGRQVKYFLLLSTRNYTVMDINERKHNYGEKMKIYNHSLYYELIWAYVTFAIETALINNLRAFFLCLFNIWVMTLRKNLYNSE